MLRLPLIGWVGVAILLTAPFLAQGGPACAMTGRPSAETLAAPACCCGPACQCCELSGPPQTPLPQGSKAPQGTASQETLSPAGGLVVTMLADLFPAPAFGHFAPLSERPVYLLTRHFRN
jgi:hypothetical protein